jgi:cation transport ATPase
LSDRYVVKLDKTGTVTLAQPRVESVTALTISQERLLQMAASVEAEFNHPIANAIVSRAVERGVQPVEVKDADYLPGQGVKATVQGHQVFLGAADAMSEAGLALPEIAGLEGRATWVVVRPGERIGVDGVVVTGQATVDQAPITGESLPVDKAVGDAVYSGTLNKSGAVEVEATGVGEETTVARIKALIHQAQEKKAPIQRVADRLPPGTCSSSWALASSSTWSAAISCVLSRCSSSPAPAPWCWGRPRRWRRPSPTLPDGASWSRVGPR